MTGLDGATITGSTGSAGVPGKAVFPVDVGGVGVFADEVGLLSTVGRWRGGARLSSKGAGEVCSRVMVRCSGGEAWFKAGCSVRASFGRGNVEGKRGFVGVSFAGCDPVVTGIGGGLAGELISRAEWAKVLVEDVWGGVKAEGVTWANVLGWAEVSLDTFCSGRFP